MIKTKPVLSGKMTALKIGQELGGSSGPPPISCTLGFNASLDYAGFGLPSLDFNGKQGSVSVGGSQDNYGVIGPDGASFTAYDMTANKYAVGAEISGPSADDPIFNVFLANVGSTAIGATVRSWTGGNWALQMKSGLIFGGTEIETIVIPAMSAGDSVGIYSDGTNVVAYAVVGGVVYEATPYALSNYTDPTQLIPMARLQTVNPVTTTHTITLHTDKSEYARTFPSGQIDMCGNII